MTYFIQFYKASPQGEVMPVQEAWGQFEIDPECLQWEVEQESQAICEVLACVGFRLWERDSQGKASPCGGMVHHKMMRGE